MKKPAVKSLKVPSAKGEDQPATRKMLYLVRDQLGSQIQSLDLKIQSLDLKIQSVDGKVQSLDLKIDSLDLRIDARFKAQDAKFLSLESKFEAVTAEMQRSNLLVEEQRADNRIVLEGLQFLMQRMQNVEQLHLR